MTETNIDAALPFPPREQPNPPPRPKHYGEAINKIVAKELLPEVIKWLEDDFRLGQEAEVEGQLRMALDRAFTFDGFKLAKRLHDQGWDCDAELVEILDGAFSEASAAHSQLVRAWVAANGITLKFEKGQRVVSDRHGPGRIVVLLPATAQYIVQTDEWLAEHESQPGWNPEEQKCSGLILAAETLKAIDA